MVYKKRKAPRQSSQGYIKQLNDLRHLPTGPWVRNFQFGGENVAYYFKEDFDTVLNRFYNEVGHPEYRTWPTIVESLHEPKGFNKDTQSKFLNHIQHSCGRHGFILFNKIDHGSWLPVFELQRKVKSLTIGIPLTIARMMKYDLAAALMAPTEVIIFEGSEEDGFWHSVQFFFPSAMVKRYHHGYPVDVKGKVMEAEKIDRRLISLIDHVFRGKIKVC